MTDKYESPFSSRYSSDYMKSLFSSDTRYRTWRKLWVSLASAQMKLGLPITNEQVEELEAHIDDIDYDVVAEREKKTRHDVMSHIYAYGLKAPGAAGIIHLGATSCYVTDNADLVIMRDGLRYIRDELANTVLKLCDFAEKYKAVPTLGYTHFQPAQLVTVGKRASLWLQDFVSDIEEIDFAIGSIKFLGCRGTTGTEASLVALLGEGALIDELNDMIASDFGFDKMFDVSGQTYTRKLDSRVINSLAALAQSAYKFADDVRLLAHDKELEEPFESGQIGSSAMAYKRNPMRCERICSLSRYLINDAGNAADTAATQWLERTLDDSANRRISIPEAFLCADAIIRLLHDVISGLVVNEKVVAKHVADYIPFIATENILMEAVKKGADRQAAHEIIRQCSMKATAAMKDGRDWNLLSDLAKEKELRFTEEELSGILDPAGYIGRCPGQVERFVAKVRARIKPSDVEIDKIDK